VPIKAVLFDLGNTLVGYYAVHPLNDRQGSPRRGVKACDWRNILRNVRCTMPTDEFQTRRAVPDDADAIALAHLDSIRSIGPKFYSPDIVKIWGAGITPDIYVDAMRAGEVFFIAIGQLDDRPAVLGFSSHRVDDAQDGTSVYVRGSVARRGIGTALLQLAEAHALAHGATVVQIQASLAGVNFYKVNGYEELGCGDAYLMSGQSMPCVFMRKVLTKR